MKLISNSENSFEAYDRTGILRFSEEQLFSTDCAHTVLIDKKISKKSHVVYSFP